MAGRTINTYNPIHQKVQGAGFISCTLVMLVCLPVRGQDTVWSRRFDSGVTDWSIGGGVDQFGDIVSVGCCRPDPESESSFVLIVKYSPAGDTLWTRRFDSDAIYDEPHNSVIDALGNIIIAGTYSYGPTGGGEVIKFDRNGNLLWFRRPSVSGYDYTYFAGVAVDDSCSIIAGGEVGYSRLPPEPDIFIIKYSPEGEEVWGRIYNLGGVFWENLNSLTFDHTRQIIAAGIIGPDYWNCDYLTVKLSRDGDTIWTRRFDLYQDDGTTGVVCDQIGNIYVCGWSDANGIHRPVLIKYSPTGARLWTRVYEPAQDADVFDAGLDSTGNVLLVGDIDDVMATSCLLMSYTPEGEFSWMRTYRLDTNSYSYSYGVSLSLSDANTMYLMGTTENSIGANPDMFVMKLRYTLGLETPTYSDPRRSGTMLNATVLSRNANVCVSVTQPADYRIVLYDLTGREVERLYQGQLEIGEYRLPIRTNLRNGVYLVRIEAGGKVQTGKVILTR